MSSAPAAPSAMELLAPVGSFAAFEAALAEGADAVYVGAPDLNARALSRDFSYGDIQAMVEHAHGRGGKVYLAMNSLVRESELEMAVDALARFARIRPDALIIQDLGLLSLARTHFPHLPLHASTLMNIHNSLGVRQLLALGCKRVVLPRELTIREIGAIHQATGAELEVFVHGAMCFSYSGLCLFSSLHGGKSSLRGQCVQPCRRRYAWLMKSGRSGSDAQGRKGGGYLFSMNDLCGIELLAQLREAGVASLKIEGRMKSAQYVRNTVRAYRLLLDGSARGARPAPGLLQEVKSLLDAAMGRRRSPGFFLDARPPEAVSPHLTGNVGQVAGKVLRLESQRARGQGGRALLTVDLRTELQVGDRLRLHDEGTGERTSFTLRALKMGARSVQQAGAGQKVTILLDQPLPGGGKGTFHGSLFKVDVSSRRREEESARARFTGRRGRNVVPDPRLVEEVLRDIAAGGGAPGEKGAGKRGRPPAWWVRIGALRDLHLRLPIRPARYLLAITPANIEAWRQARGRGRRGGEGLVWCLPPVIMEGELDWFRDTVAALRGEGCTDFQLGHFSQRLLFAGEKNEENLQLYSHYTCNLLNSMAVRFLSGLGLAGVQFSIETDRDNLRQALGRLRRSVPRPCAVGLYVYGRPPLFSARLDDRRYLYGKRFVSPKGEAFVIEQREGMTQARAVLPFSLLEWRTELEALGIEYLVADLSTGPLKKNIAEFTTLFHHRGELPPTLGGNYLGGLV